MFTRWTILWLCCIISQHATAIVGAPQSRAASITLKAKWAGTSTLLEAIQFLVWQYSWSNTFPGTKTCRELLCSILLTSDCIDCTPYTPRPLCGIGILSMSVSSSGLEKKPAHISFYGRLRMKDMRCGNSLMDGTRKRGGETVTVGTRFRMLQPPSSHLP